jgi:hypothetical protein
MLDLVPWAQTALNPLRRRCIGFAITCQAFPGRFAKTIPAIKAPDARRWLS